MEVTTQKGILIEKKKELATLEMQLANLNDLKSAGFASGTVLFLSFGGIIILFISSAGRSLPGMLLGILLIVLAIRRYRRSLSSRPAKNVRKKILEIKNQIIELENS